MDYTKGVKYLENGDTVAPAHRIHTSVGLAMLKVVGLRAVFKVDESMGVIM